MSGAPPAGPSSSSVADGTPSAAPLAQQVRRSLGWSVLNNVLTRSATLLTGIVLARLLVPEDYGVFAVALVALQLLMSLNDVGLSAAVIRWPGDVRALTGTAYVLVLGASGLLFGVSWVGAPAFADVLGAPDAVGVVRAMSVALLVDGSVGVHTALLTREFAQGRRAVADVTNVVVYAAVAVVLACLGAGPWSMVWGRLAGNGVSAVIIWWYAPRVRPGWDTAQARALLRFGVPLAGSSVLLVLIANIDYVVVGGVLGPVQLGLYVLAFNLSSWPVNMFSFAVRRVSLAGFAQLLPDRERTAAAFGHALSLLLAAALPVCVLLAVLAGPVVHVLYGAKWSGAVPALVALALLGAARIALELAYDLLVAAGHTRRILVLQLIWLVLLGPALLVGARLDGTRGVGLAQLAVALLVVVPTFTAAVQRAGVPGGLLARSSVRPLLGGAAAALVAAAVLAGVPGPLPQLLVAGPCAIAAHLAVVWPLRVGLRGVLTPATA